MAANEETVGGAMKVGGDAEDVIDPEAALQSMEAGERFTVLTEGDEDSGEVQPLPVLLSYQPPSQSAPMGRFVWTDSSSSSSSSSPSSSVSLDQLTDVYLGPQSSAFRLLPSTFPSPSPDSCASLVFSSPLQLDLIAHSDAALNRWLAGINRILQVGGRGSRVEEEEEKEGAAAEEAVDGSAAVALMKGGCTFTRFLCRPSADGASHEVQAERLRLTYEADDGQQEGGLGLLRSPSSSLPLSSLTDVLVGPQTSTFSLSPASSAPPALCISLLSTSGQWDLQADSEADLSAWLAGIHHVLTQSEEPQEAGEERQSTAARAASPQQRASAAPARPSFHPMESSTLQSALVAGDWFDLRHSASPTPLRVFLFLNPQASRMGCLYWTEREGGREERLSQSLALHTLSDVRVGVKAAEVGGWAATTEGGEDGGRHLRCLSLLSRREKSSLHLQAVGGERVVKQWVRGIRLLLHTRGATIQQAGGKGPVSSEGPLPAPAASQSTAPPSTAPSLPPSLLALLSSLLPSTPMSLLTSTASYPVSLSLSPVTSSDGSPTLTYRHLSPAMASTKAKRVSVRRVTDLYLGFSSPSLRHSGWADGAKVNGACVWSLCTRRVTWDLCCTGEEDRGRWVSGLRELIVHLTRKTVVDDGADDEWRAGEEVKAQSVGPSTASRRMSFQPSKAVKAEVSEGAAALAQLTSGLRFARYERVDGLSFKQPIVLLYRQRRERGRVEEVLYWAEDSTAQSKDSGRAATPPLLPSNALPVDRITDIFLGKQTPLLSSPSASAAAEERCIALLSHSLVLELEASQSTVASALLQALQFICQDGGRQMEEEKAEEASEESEASRLKAAQLQMLARKGAKGRRFSLGPALQNGGVHRRLSCLSSRLSMLATVQEDDSALSLPGHSSIHGLLHGSEDCLDSFRSAAGDSAAASSLGLLQDGRVFTGYTEDSRGRYHQSTLLLFLSLSPPTLHWCPYGVKQTHANASLPLSSLQSVLLGKVTPALLSPLAHHANSERCLALQSAERSIDVEGKDEKTLLALLLSLQCLLQKEGKTLKAEATEAGGRRLTVAPAAPRGAPEVPLPPPRPLQGRAQVTLPSPLPQPSRSLPSGRSFDLLELHFHVDVGPVSSSTQRSASPHVLPSLVRRSIQLSFNGQSLQWLTPSQSSTEASPAPSTLALRAIRDIYCGHSTATMRRAAELSAAPIERSVSVVGKGVELNLLASSQAELRAFVAELMALLKTSGKVVCEEKTSKGQQSPSSAATPPVTPPPLPHRPAAVKAALSRGDKENQSGGLPSPSSSPSPSRRISVVGSSSRRLSARSASPQTLALLQRMVDGRRFLLHSATAGEQSSAAVRPVLLTYQAATHSLALHPFPATGRSTSSSSPLQSLPLRLLTEVVTGKQTAVFLSSACQSVERGRCVCLVAGTGSRGLQLHLEADSSAALSAWLKDLQALLALQGKVVLVEGSGGAGQKTVGMDAAAARRFSIRNAGASAHSNRPALPLKAATVNSSTASGGSRMQTLKGSAGTK